ncbi:unnamed protein product [Ranitomeya imitator]|uniref:Uncharacterized protein n=1 Tax=Ranitomeya imitator TaxID=111125 RepID=A0ABN9LI73_9NEOB|nr:unnamed protein product [Ranitomeya imitator]
MTTLKTKKLKNKKLQNKKQKNIKHKTKNQSKRYYLNYKQKKTKQCMKEFILDNRALWLALKRCLKMKPGSKYKKLHAVLEQDTNWPPIGTTSYRNCIKTYGDDKIYINQGYEHDSVLNDEHSYPKGQKN